MAHGRQEFALVGYSEYLERKPLKFVDPIPPSRICSACGNVPRLTLTLLCGHTFCEPCFESCATTSEFVCPLDGETCVRADVTSKEYPAENLLRRKVHCWNEVNGCGVVVPASQVAQHFRCDCEHHVTRCPKCRAAVLTHDICAHLKSQCEALVLHSAPGAPQRTDNNENTHFAKFEREVKQGVQELDAKLARLSLENDSQSDKLIELCQNMNHLNEALKEQVGQAAVQTLDRLDRNEAEMRALVEHQKMTEQRVGALDSKLALLSLETGSLSDTLVEIRQNNNHLKEALDGSLAEIKALYTEKNESLRIAITSALASVPSDQTTHQRVLKEYAALKKAALKDGRSVSMSDEVYLRRYRISWGIFFEKDGDSVYVSLRIQLHEGRDDEFLHWPLTKELKLSIIHPDTRRELNLGGKPKTDEARQKNYSRPIDGSNRAVYFGKTRVESSDLERDGYVKDNKLLLRFEMLQ